MKKKSDLHLSLWVLLKKTLALRFTFLLSMIFIVPAFSAGYAQNEKITLKTGSLPVEQVINELRKMSSYQFLFNHEELSALQIEKTNFKDASIDEVMNALLKNSKLTYTVKNNVIVISPRQAADILPQVQSITIKGNVTDRQKIPMAGVTILLKGTYTGVTSDHAGNFSIILPGDVKPLLLFSFVGMKTLEVAAKPNILLAIVMEEDEKQIDEVVVTGFFNRDKNSFTGNAKVVSGEELKTAGSQNLLKSLSILDPTLVMVENNNLGSDPNSMPKIRFRGESQFQDISENLDKSKLVGDPNLPTFIMDGYETTVQIIMDMDMNRIESVTILKDAAATAIYGSRAANGVIVVKTKQPKAGKLQISYNLDMDFNFPDLRSYNLINSEESKILYNQLGMFRMSDGSYRDPYPQICRWIAQGVNTDWLAQPVRNTVSHRHSVNLMGGDKFIRYSFDVRYSDNPGVMKESDRKNLGLGMNLQYNMKDKLLFSNNLTVGKNNSKDSPYGSFADYTKLNSYFPLYDGNGELTTYFALQSVYQLNALNPLKEALVGNFNKNEYVDVTDNFSIDWTILEGLRLRGQFSYTLNTSKSNNFLSPNSYVAYPFDSQVPKEERGRYNYSDNRAERYDGNVILTYMKGIGKHFLNFSGGININENKSQTFGFTAAGFGDSDAADPAFAAGYEKDGMPQSAEGKTRMFGVLASLNYSYDNRYLLDLSYRLDGSSQFGSNKKNAPFFSAGLGWNVHKEKFMENVTFIKLLKFRGSYGQVGSVSFAPYQARDMYDYYKDLRYEGNVGAKLIALGNENLRWQTTVNQDYGFDINLFEYVTVTASYYNKKTEDMVLPVTTPPSVGFGSFTENLGRMSNKGFDFSIRTFVYKGQDLTASVYVNGNQNRNKILAISNTLTAFNDRGNNREDYKYMGTEVDEGLFYAATHKFLVQYQSGESNNAIYAVRSLGIDPMTGQEFFLTKDGRVTPTWDDKDKVVVGNTEPTLRGGFGANVSWKGLYLNVDFQYEFGGEQYNSTLVNKIENVDKSQNVDRRVLTETWKKPGDVVKYKTNIGLFGTQEFTPASSRFVQKNNLLRLGAASIQYELPHQWVKPAGFESVRLSLNMADIMYVSTIQRERGTDYPFARSFSLGLRVSF